MYLHRFRLYVLAILPIKTLLCDFANVNLGVEIRGKGFMMITSIAIDNVEILYFIKVMLGSVCRKDAGNAWVEAATKDGAKSGLLEALAIRPLP